MVDCLNVGPTPVPASQDADAELLARAELNGNDGRLLTGDTFMALAGKRNTCRGKETLLQKRTTCGFRVTRHTASRLAWKMGSFLPGFHLIVLRHR
jgi:negative regulator of sigma E activity